MSGATGAAFKRACFANANYCFVGYRIMAMKLLSKIAEDAMIAYINDVKKVNEACGNATFDFPLLSAWHNAFTAIERAHIAAAIIWHHDATADAAHKVLRSPRGPLADLRLVAVAKSLSMG
jgi:hypothetical protein